MSSSMLGMSSEFRQAERRPFSIDVLRSTFAA